MKNNARRITAPQKEVRTKLKQLEMDGILKEKETQPTDWINSMVTKKSNYNCALTLQTLMWLFRRITIVLQLLMT